MENTNEMTIIFDSYSSNEAFARVAVAAFMTSLNPTVEEVADVKTAVSEAVTNAIIHGYESRIEKITLRCKTCGDTLYIEIEDHGKGMEDVKKAMEPLFTTRQGRQQQHDRQQRKGCEDHPPYPFYRFRADARLFPLCHRPEICAKDTKFITIRTAAPRPRPTRRPRCWDGRPTA